MFENSDVIKLNLQQIFQFYRRKEIWVILFHKAKDEESKKLKDEYKLLAEKMYGILKVGAVECEDDEELCEEFGVYQVPTLMVYQESYGDDGEKYQGKLDWKSIGNFATYKMQSFVSIVTLDNYEQFVNREPSKYKVLLFTQRKTTAPIFKALSKQYKDKLLFGEVRQSEKALVDKFNVKTLPTLMVITDPYEYTGEVYSGDLKIDQLTKFLNQYSYKTATYEKKLEILTMTEEKYKQGLCARKSRNICLVIFDKSLAPVVEQILPYYQKDKIDFVLADKYALPSVHE